jgi:hypothetical protein
MDKYFLLSNPILFINASKISPSLLSFAEKYYLLYYTKSDKKSQRRGRKNRAYKKKNLQERGQGK